MKDFYYSPRNLFVDRDGAQMNSIILLHHLSEAIILFHPVMHGNGEVCGEQSHMQAVQPLFWPLEYHHIFVFALSQVFMTPVKLCKFLKQHNWRTITS